MRTQELLHVNATPAQTWNHLHINETAFTVGAPDSTGKVYESVPRLFEGIECGVGRDAANWMAAAAGDGRYVEVPHGIAATDPIVIAVGAGEVANTAVMVRTGATATVVVVARDERNADADVAPGRDAVTRAATGNTSAALTRIFCERDARLRLVELVCVGTDAQHLEGVGIHAEEGASVEVRQYALGGRKVAFGIAVDLAGGGSEVDLTMRYHAGGTDSLDVNQLCRMRGRGTRTEMHASGVLSDAAHKTLRQTIDLVHGAKGAKGNESDTALVMGDDVVNKTLPTILCDEDDVSGNHGSTIGSISPEQLAYLANRGLDRQAAEGLLVRAIFDDAVIHMPEGTSRAPAVARAVEVLGPEVAHDLAEGLGLSDSPSAEREGA